MTNGLGSTRASLGRTAAHPSPGFTPNSLKTKDGGESRASRVSETPSRAMSIIERGASMTELAPALTIPEGQTLKDLVQEYERQLLLMALELAGWNQRKVAASLGLLPSTLSEKMKRLGLRSTRPEVVVNDGSAPAARP